MRNLTITIDNETLKKARIRALEQGTSVNALLRDFLEAYSGVRVEQKNAVKNIIAFSRSSSSRRGNSRWTRESLHERR
jgi:plasmid stability protein